MANGNGTISKSTPITIGLALALAGAFGVNAYQVSVLDQKFPTKELFAAELRALGEKVEAVGWKLQGYAELREEVASLRAEVNVLKAGM